MTRVDPHGSDPHASAALLRAGDAAAPVGIVLIHGRGDSAPGILTLLPELASRGSGPLRVVAPEAVGRVWYPQRFIEPLERNEPHLTSALATVARAVAALDLPRERIVVAGFSQGACLACEYVARAGGRWGGVVALSGGLIGDGVDPLRYPTPLDGTPAFVGCSDRDLHIPLARVQATAAQLRAQGAAVDERIYPGMPHTVVDDELHAVAALLAAVGRAA
jgi:phospholipase/carboxylesterase